MRSSAAASARWAAAASVTYVLAWIVGLAAAPAVPAGISPVEMQEQLADHRLGALVQSLLVHGTAGAALAVLAVSLVRLAAPRLGGRGPVLVAGVAAAVLSWVQVALFVVLLAGLDGGDPERTSALREAIDRVDGVKLLALAVFAVAATIGAHRVRLCPRWLVVAARALAPLLLAGATSFVVASPLLTATLYIGLPLLLLVVGGTGIAAWRQSRCRTESPSPSADGPGGQASRRRSAAAPATSGTTA
ncbi:hypothetical protein [Blastococcus sp. VKM Ac-2987]|uniref:hypothetical protein n=1 Tax=Blastococcus sp. VKM Ac-2987 TaxID=3004141 RepID=UPI0022AB782B|nr:hypothetical protein [Blastococcus sp. VKM Ac-2987]MCZ2860832.1 hypothetical protein [Blastococcus sp. VKM Ac-2987]